MAGGFELTQKIRWPMSKFTTIVEGPETVTGIEVEREIRHSIDFFSAIVSNGFAGCDDCTPDLITVQTADGRYHKGPEKKE